MKSHACTLTLLILVALVGHVTSCRFPDWAQTNGTQRDWRSVVRSQNSEYSQQLTIGRDTIRAVATDAFAKTYSRICIQEYPGQRFLVAHDERGQRKGRYTCIQFVRRGDGVVQLKEVGLFDRMHRRLCEEEKFKVMEWLILDMNVVLNNREQCTLKGGYDTSVYDKTMLRAYCDGYEGETRLESECEPGDSLTFQFRQQVCVPEEMFMYSRQRTFCLVNWQEEGFNFTLLRHDRYNYMWVLRYPSDAEDSFTVHLFKDLFAPTESTISGNENYLQISMSRRPDFNISTICEDDYEICSVLKNPCTYSDQMALTCPKTCGLCNRTIPAECTLPEGFQGAWADAGHPDRQALAISPSTLHFTGTNEQMRCISWGNPVDGVDGIKTYMFVSSSHKGCGPRYMCGRLSQISPHVMYLQISQSQRWPLIKKPTESIDCSQFVYDVDHSMNKNRYRSRHMKLLVSTQTNISTTCDLSDFQHLEVRFDNDVSCKGRLVQPEEKDSMSFEFDNCAEQRLGGSFSCLELASHPVTGEEVLITRSEDEQIHCWMFPSRPRNHMQLIAGTDCDEVAPRRIKKGRLVPLATIVARKVTKTTLSREENELDIEVEGAPGNNTVVNNTKTERNHTVLIHEHNTTESHTEGSIIVSHTIDIPLDRTSRVNDSIVISYNASADAPWNNSTNVTINSHNVEGSPSPILVTALIVTLVAVQLTLICTCRCIS